MDRNKLDYSRLASELLRAVRGKRSQRALSQALGSSFNIAHRWESGVTRIAWTDFTQVCDASGVPWRPVLRRELGLGGGHDEPIPTAELLRRLLGDFSVSDAARATGRSRFVISRWLSGKTDPWLEDVLRLLDVNQGILLEVADQWTDVSTVPTLRSRWEEKKKLKDLVYRYPYAMAVLRALELPRFAGRSEFNGELAKFAGFPVEREREVIGLLEKSGAIAFENGVTRVRPEVLDLRGNFRGGREVRKYWARKHLEFLEGLHAPPARSLDGYSVFSVSEAAEEKIREAYFEFYAKLRLLVQEDSEVPDRVKVMTFQLIDLSESPPNPV